MNRLAKTRRFAYIPHEIADLLTAPELNVLRAMLKLVKGGKECFAETKKIAAAAKRKDRAVQNNVASMIAKGVLEKANDGRRTHRSYRILWRCEGQHLEAPGSARKGAAGGPENAPVSGAGNCGEPRRKLRGASAENCGAHIEGDSSRRGSETTERNMSPAPAAATTEPTENAAGDPGLNNNSNLPDPPNDPESTGRDFEPAPAVNVRSVEAPTTKATSSPPAQDFARNLAGKFVQAGAGEAKPERISNPSYETRKTPEAAHLPRPEVMSRHDLDLKIEEQRKRIADAEAEGRPPAFTANARSVLADLEAKRDRLIDKEAKPSPPPRPEPEAQAGEREYRPPDGLTEEELAAWEDLRPREKAMLEVDPNDKAARKELAARVASIAGGGILTGPAMQEARADPHQWAHLVQGGHMPAPEFGARLRELLKAEPRMEPGYSDLGEHVGAGRLDPEDIAAALDASRHPAAESESKVFWAELKRSPRWPEVRCWRKEKGRWVRRGPNRAS